MQVIWGFLTPILLLGQVQCVWHRHPVCRDPLCLLLPLNPLCVPTALCCAPPPPPVPGPAHSDFLSHVPADTSALHAELTQYACRIEL